MRTVALIGQPDVLETVYAPDRLARLAERANLLPGFLTPANLDEREDEAREVEALFSTWGMPSLPEDEIARRFPRLGAVFYAAGTVKGFASPFLARGAAVVSAWAANARPVAETTLAQILLSGKGYWSNALWAKSPEARARGPRRRGPGNYGSRVAIVGAGQIGRRVLELLKPFDFERVVVDPYLADDRAAALGAKRVTLEEAFATALVVSNHLPNLPALEGSLGYAHFASMPLEATFVNTGRGQQVDEAGLARALRERPDLTALLDVTWPEPPVADSPLYTLPNVWLSDHMAGAEGNELLRMVDWMLDEFEAWEEGRALRYGVTAAMLETMA